MGSMKYGYACHRLGRSLRDLIRCWTTSAPVCPDSGSTWRRQFAYDSSGNRPFPNGHGALGCILVAMLLLITGCRLNTDELDFTRNEPAKADIIGKWIRVSDSSEDGKQSSATKQKLNLRGDGSFWVVELPTSPGMPGASPKGLLSGTGVWRLDKDTGSLPIGSLT